MVKRVKSSDGRKETDKVLGAAGNISGQGREGGTLARDIATRDEKKRAFERPAGITRMSRSDERGAAKGKER